MPKPKLYHYVHCPYCVRVRLAAGYLEVAYESHVLDYDDEKTPIEIMGKKMLPIWSDSNSFTSNESLEIISKLDSKGVLSSPETQAAHQFSNLLGGPIHNLVMPYWIYTKEFNERSRKYFQDKKEVKRGPFSQLIANRKKFEKDLEPLLVELETDLNPFWKSNNLTLADIILASHLWGLYMLPEFQFSENTHTYLQAIKSKCHFNYHEDFWSRS